MSPVFRFRRICALIAMVFLPVVGSAQESSTAKEEKKSEKAEPKPELTRVETSEEHKENLDRKLDSSLSEFDALILHEQEILEERRESSAAAGGSAGAGKAEVGGGSGGGAQETEKGASGGEESGDPAKSGGTGGSKDDPAGEASGESHDREGGGERAGGVSNGPDRVPPDVGDGSDDDIVARQLREAAMKEEDPALREKLWDEYRAYRFGEKKKTGT